MTKVCLPYGTERYLQKNDSEVEKTIGKVYLRINMTTYAAAYGYIVRTPDQSYSLTPLMKDEDSLLTQEYVWDYDPDFFPENREWVLAELDTGSPIAVYRGGVSLSGPLDCFKCKADFEHPGVERDEREPHTDFYHVGVPELATMQECLEEDLWEDYSPRMALNEVSVNDWKFLGKFEIPRPSVTGEYVWTKALVSVLRGRAFARVVEEKKARMINLASGQVVYETRDGGDWFYGGYAPVAAAEILFEEPFLPGIYPPDVDFGYVKALRDAGFDYDMLATRGEFVREAK